MIELETYDTCNINCPYFPDMTCESNEWEYDQEKGYKIRKELKVFRCLYDNHPINWSLPCPRKLLIDGE